jgi:signal transduction histidine kinase
VNAVIEDALSIAKYYKRKKGKRIVTNYASGLPRLRCVRDQLVQVFLNLILNAMDATRDGGLIEITSRLESGWIRVTVRDDGRGIAETHRRTIFEPYFTTKPTGTGLGLFVCRHILSGMDDEGRIDLLNTSPHGTTFEVAVTCENVRNCPDSLEESSVVSTEEVPAT